MKFTVDLRDAAAKSVVFLEVIDTLNNNEETIIGIGQNGEVEEDFAVANPADLPSLSVPDRMRLVSYFLFRFSYFANKIFETNVT